ncbi:ATP-dependent zinc metalloprotease FtsH [Tenuifilum thalassicum]|uniref:ATP-dependent zinc metalloprotease FtsH n=1 Tax=Tenuifilum thalassicum TaxID=2590900 RepID=A0A7D3Y2R3_9BACT|nr:ATP-dependent zinc metalloprotease FtsH [Tenuifilum thalassicum]QKG78989.1 ATP-dependent zinc metalloprotease FtsH [Tenuifilum thalassicum]
MAENGNKKPLINETPGNKPKLPKFNVYWVYIIIILGFFLLQYFYSGKSAQVTTWQEVKNQMIANQEIDKLVVIRNLGKVEVYLKEDKLEKYKDRLGDGFGAVPKVGPHFYFTIGSIETFEKQLADAQANIDEAQKIYPQYEDQPNYWGDILSWVLPFVLLLAIWIFIFRRISGGTSGGAGGGNIFSVGKSKAQVFDKETRPRVDFKDVAGLEEAKVEVMEIVDFLKNPQKYTDLGGKIPKGALLVGPPGTGKTLLAKAVAGEANVPFFSISGSEFVEMFVGVGASRVRDLFRQAKEKAPCIVFIDEIDAIGRARGKNPSFSGNDERENTLNQLLTEMDGFASNQGVIILAATNRADILDRALLRAGRFDRQIHVDLPDLKERLEIFKVHLRPLKLEANLDISFLAKQTPGFSGADIANVCNEAALIAARKNKKFVEKQDFLDAIDRIIGGLEKKNKIISKEERKTIAYHEAGHATVSWLLEHANPLLKVSIIPRGRSLGAAWYLPEERQITTTEQLFDEMCSALGGRAAEEINFNKISTGALSDLERVTKQAYAMIAYFGMGKKLKNISYYDSTQSEFTFSKPYSEKTAEQIDQEVREIIDKAYEKAKEILTQNREGHVQLAELLLEREVIYSEDLEKIFGPRKTLSREQELVKELEEEAQKNNTETTVSENNPEA